METSILYDLLARGIINEWRESAEKDIITSIDMREEQLKTELLKVLPHDYKNLLNHYRLAIEDRLDYIHYSLQIKLLNIGVKIGMELGRAFILDEQ